MVLTDWCLSQEALKCNPFQAVMLDWTAIWPLVVLWSYFLLSLFLFLIVSTGKQWLHFVLLLSNKPCQSTILLAFLLSSTAKLVAFACQKQYDAFETIDSSLCFCLVDFENIPSRLCKDHSGIDLSNHTAPTPIS